MQLDLDQSRCKKIVGIPPGYWHFHQCTRKIWKDGYCKQHHPDTVAARNKKRKEKYESKFNKLP